MAWKLPESPKILFPSEVREDCITQSSTWWWSPPFGWVQTAWIGWQKDTILQLWGSDTRGKAPQTKRRNHRATVWGPCNFLHPKARCQKTGRWWRRWQLPMPWWNIWWCSKTFSRRCDECIAIVAFHTRPCLGYLFEGGKGKWDGRVNYTVNKLKWGKVKA